MTARGTERRARAAAHNPVVCTTRSERTVSKAYPVDLVHRQTREILLAWGMSEEHAQITADLMTETDLRGVDSHGISMLPSYEQQIGLGQVNVRPLFKTKRETPTMALIDADASIGHPAAHHGMNLAVDKALKTGVGVVSVVNSNHFGAAGCYSKIASERGCIGMVTSATRGVMMVPTFASEPILGTNPFAFAAPAKRNRDFELDMATTTVAANKVKVYWLNRKPIPQGWVVDGNGQPVTDSVQAMEYLFGDAKQGGITPLGGTRDLGSHKGYGLATMVHILGGVLSGASFSPIRNLTQKVGEPNNLGHFFMAIDPRAFRDEGEFENDLDAVIDVLHGARRADPQQPVLVAGDPESATRAERMRSGIPLPDDLINLLRGIASRAKTSFLLG
ncbi:MAG: Ldh family oxidoreductase [Betaproteobacteria bacterium]|nr:MAG: Ldh family oxidoreductase [Betaproteobacteria bacterium]